MFIKNAAANFNTQSYFISICSFLFVINIFISHDFDMQNYF